MTDTIKTWQERTKHCGAPRHHDFYSCMMQAEIDELRALLDQPDEPKADYVPCYSKPIAEMIKETQAPTYYMRDNHTFKKLNDAVPTALVEIEAEFNAGYTSGMLCSKRDGFRQVHAQGEKLRMFFLNACKESLEHKEQP